jgi:GT2 family glycosyltransferase
MAGERIVTIVVPFFNQISYLVQALRSVVSAPSRGFRVKVVLFDNASEEQLHTSLLDEMGLDWTLFRNQVNLAVSKPWNTGIRLALEVHGAEAVCLLNSDVIVGEGWIEHCMRALDEGAYCSFPLAYTDGGALPGDFDARAKLAAADRLEEAYANLRLENNHQPVEDCYSIAYRNPPTNLLPPAHPTDGFCGYCFFVSRECIEKIGYFDEAMMLLYSDVDYRNRLIDAGHPPVCVHRCLLHHFGSRTILPLLEAPGPKTTMASDKEYFYRKWNTAYSRSWRNHCIGINSEVP